MTDIDVLVDVICTTIDDAIADLTLTDAAAVLDQLGTEIRVRRGGITDDLRRHAG